MSQDELAEKIGVSRQSISLWETEQTQPTIDNIIALAKIFNISSDMLLADADDIGNTDADVPKKDSTEEPAPKKKSHAALFITLGVIAAVLIAGGVFFAMNMNTAPSDEPVSSADTAADPEAPAVTTNSSTPKKPAASTPKPSAPVSTSTPAASAPEASTPAPATSSEAPAAAPQFDLFTYCKDFAIKKGNVNGDYCIYQQDASKYGGYDDEYFSISYWNDSNMVEFCLHCPLSDTQSHNFYLRMRGGYNKKYEYLSSKYYRDNGESFRTATGYIDPTVFSDNYPISCDSYKGDTDGQNQFMEETRVGICDLIRCLKKFVEVEKMECSFSDFDFANF